MAQESLCATSSLFKVLKNNRLVLLFKEEDHDSSLSFFLSLFSTSWGITSTIRNNSIQMFMCTVLLLNTQVEFSSNKLYRPEFQKMFPTWSSDTASAHLAGRRPLRIQPADEGADTSRQRVVQHRQRHLNEYIIIFHLGLQAVSKTVVSISRKQTVCVRSPQWKHLFLPKLVFWFNFYVFGWGSKQVSWDNKASTNWQTDRGIGQRNHCPLWHHKGLICRTVCLDKLIYYLFLLSGLSRHMQNMACGPYAARKAF